MCAFDRGVSGAKPRADVEGGRAPAADDDVVCVGVVLAAVYIVAWREVLVTASSLFLLAFSTRQDQCTRFWFCMYFQL
jgi:hypothetical protein